MVPVCQKIWKDTRFPSSFAPIDKYPYASEFVIQIYKIFISTDFYIFMFLGCRICVSVFHKFGNYKLIGTSLCLILFSIHAFNFSITFSNNIFSCTKHLSYIFQLFFFFAAISDPYGYFFSEKQDNEVSENLLAGCHIQFTLLLKTVGQLFMDL
jgi:hypothetical protein